MRETFVKAGEMPRQSGLYLDDLRRLLVFHGLANDTPDILSAIKNKLGENNALRTDLSALAQHISNLEQRTVSDDEILLLIALAAQEFESDDETHRPLAKTDVSNLKSLLAGPDPSDFPSSPDPARSTESGERTSDPALGADHALAAEAAPTSDSHVLSPLPARLGPDAFLPTHMPVPNGSNGVGRPDPAAVGGSQAWLELAITELKVYLDDIDRRIGRLEPRLEDISRIIQPPRNRFLHSAAPPESLSHESPPPPRQATDILATEPAVSHRFSRSPRGEHRSGSSRLEPIEPVIPIHPPPPESPPHLIVEHVSFPPESPEIGAQTNEETMTLPLDNGRPRSLRETTGRLLGLVAVVLAAVACVSAVIAFRGSHATSAVANPARQLSQAPPQAPVSVAQVASALAPSKVAATPTPPPVQQTANAKPAPRPAEPQAALPAPPPPIARENLLPPARVAGKRSELPRREPRIETFAPAPVTSPALSTHRDPPSVATRTTSRDDATLPAGNPRPTLAVPAAVSSGGAPQIEAHSPLQSSLIASRKPVYPTEALREHREGSVTLNAVIAKDGTVRRMDVVQGSAGFTQSALNAVSWWRYKPQRNHGEAAEVETRITFDYRLH